MGLVVEIFVDLRFIVEICVNLGLIVIIRKLTAFTSVLPDTRVAVPHPDGIGIAYNGPVAVIAGIVGRVQRLIIGVPPNRALADLLGQRGVVFGVVHALAGAGCRIAHGPAAGLFCTGRSGLGVSRGCLDGLDVPIRVLNGILIFLHNSGTISRSIRAGSCLAHKVCQRLGFAGILQVPLLYRIALDDQLQGRGPRHTATCQNFQYRVEHAVLGGHLRRDSHIYKGAPLIAPQHRVVNVQVVALVHPHVDLGICRQRVGAAALVQRYRQDGDGLVILD